MRLSLLLFASLVCSLAALGQQRRSILADGEFRKLEISEDGVHIIDYEGLEAMGFSPQSLDPNQIELYGYGGGPLPQPNAAPRIQDLPPLALKVVGGEDGAFDEQDYILFYAEGTSPVIWDEEMGVYRRKPNPYAMKSYYFLKVDGQGNHKIEERPDQPSGFTTAFFREVNHFEEEENNLVISGREWFGKDIADQFESEPYSLENLEPDGVIEVAVNIVNRSVSDVSFTAYANGINLGEISMSSVPRIPYGDKGQIGSSVFQFPVQLVADDSDLVISLVTESDPDLIFVHLDYLTVNLPRRIAYEGQQRIIRSLEEDRETLTYKLKDFDQNYQIWDITDASRPYEVIPEKVGNPYTFTGSSDSKWILFTPEDAFKPEDAGPVEPQDLCGIATPNFLIVTTETFRPEAERLAAFRASHDQMEVAVVGVEQIFNEFSSGRQDVTAIRDYVRFLYQQDEEKLKYLLLFGDASYDYLDRREENTNLVPTYQSRNSVHNIFAFASDDYFTFMGEEEGEWGEGLLNLVEHTAEIGVGRLPVKTLEEAKNVVDKSIHYATNTQTLGDWRTKIVYVADDGDNNRHHLQADALASYVETDYLDYNPNRIFVGAYPKSEGRAAGVRTSPIVRDLLQTQINNGALIVNFNGHGSEIAWTAETILSRGQIERWRNNNVMPLFVTATCEFGRFDDWRRVSGAEEAVLRPDGGAIAMLSTARPSFINTGFKVNEAFYQSLIEHNQGQPLRLGDIQKFTKNNSIAGTVNRHFTLLGDPSLTLALPTGKVVITEVANLSRPGQTPRGLDQVQIKGQVELDSVVISDFDGQLNLSLYDVPQERTTVDSTQLFTFTNRDNLLFRGRAKVKSGTFNTTLLLPLTSSDRDQLKISLYAQHDNQMMDAVGSYNELAIDEHTNTIVNEPPRVTLFFEDTLSPADRGKALETPRLLALLEDEDGINLNAENGRGIQLVVDSLEDLVINLAPYYATFPDNFQRGLIDFTMFPLAEGSHELTLKVWDNQMNGTERSISFFVNGLESGETIVDYTVYPNPFEQSFNLKFTHQIFDPFQLTLQLYDLTGGLVSEVNYEFGQYTTSEAEITFDLERQGLLPRPGVYLYRVVIFPDNGESEIFGGRVVKQ